MPKNDLLELFRQKVAEIMEGYAKQTKLMVAENLRLGLSMATVGKMLKDENSPAGQKRNTLNKAIKREIGGLINRLHIEAYTQGLK